MLYCLTLKRVQNIISEEDDRDLCKNLGCDSSILVLICKGDGVTKRKIENVCNFLLSILFFINSIINENRLYFFISVMFFVIGMINAVRYRDDE